MALLADVKYIKCSKFKPHSKTLLVAARLHCAVCGVKGTTQWHSRRSVAQQMRSDQKDK